MDRPVAPPGWPREVRPPGTPDWERTAAAWLLAWANGCISSPNSSAGMPTPVSATATSTPPSSMRSAMT